MNNRGYVTIFISLVLVVMLVVAIAVMDITDRNAAKTKIVTATSSAMSSQMANYNRFIFDRYHILLLDKNYSGAGEGAIEQNMVNLLEIDLGEDYRVNDVCLSGTVGLMDDDLAEFKKQINDDFKFEALDYTVNKIIDVTEGNDDPVTDEDIAQMEENISSEEQRIEQEIEASESVENQDASETSEDNDAEESEEVEDPRDTLKTYTDAGLAEILLPEDAVLSENQVSGDDLPSSGRRILDFQDMDTSFEDKDRMKLDTKKGNGWGSGLLTNMEAIMYGAECFNCLTDQKYDDTYLSLEMEYLVGGEKSDGKNYKKVVNEILLIRFGFNFAYIITDSEKEAECEALATALTVEFPPAEPVVKYLLMGCWSYIESVADVYLLLRGHKVPFWKGMDTWVTDFESLGHLDEISEVSDDEQGLDYKEYLMILMALQGDEIYYRMLDLMQLNVTQPNVEGGDETFRMSNAITAFGTDVDVSYKGKEYEIHEEKGY